MSTADDFFANATSWSAELTELRRIAPASGLEETYSAPIPTGDSSAPARTRAPRRSCASWMWPSIHANTPVVTAFLREALQIERADLQIELSADEPDYVEELSLHLAANDAFRATFAALTPGRRRMYWIHFAQPKKAETRVERILRATPRVLAGEGLNDCICGMTKRKLGCDGSHKHLA